MAFVALSQCIPRYHMQFGLALPLCGRGASASAVALPSGAVHHYDFSDNANLTLSGSDITGAADLGTGSAPLSNSAGNYPSNTGTVNSIQAALFNDANDDVLKALTGLDSSFNDTAPPLTVSVVFQCSRSNLNLCLVGLYGSGEDSDPRIFCGLNTTGQYECYVRDESGNVAPTSRLFGARDTSAHVLTMTLAADGTMNVWLDGTLGVTSADASTAATRAVNQIGVGAQPTTSGNVSFPYEGAIGEVVAWGTALNADDVAAANAFLADKWAIT